MKLPMGPVMIGIAGLELTENEKKQLMHPAVGGVALFSRNYASPAQLKALTQSIHALRDLLVAVDHEGGRVQRFREGFTRIPPMRALGNLWDEDAAAAQSMARAIGVVVATELAEHGVDFSFAPVLDVDHGNSSVIGHRALHCEPQVVADLASALQAGMAACGMTTVGKHFPGHGFAHADSHVALPVDERSFADIEGQDLLPFARLIREGMGAVMPAHVVYPRVDALAAGFSPRWLQDILRGQLGFRGAIMSDDLGMAGAAAMGDMIERADVALDAGCDLLLSCNEPAATAALLGCLQAGSEISSARLAALQCKPGGRNSEYSHARDSVAAFTARVAPEGDRLVAQPEDIVARL